MWPDWVSNPGPLALESDAPLTALRSLAVLKRNRKDILFIFPSFQFTYEGNFFVQAEQPRVFILHPWFC